MNRNQIINIIGTAFLTQNLENGEYSYPKAFKAIGKNFHQKTGETTHSYLDIRFERNGVSILVETKNNFDKWNIDDVYRQIQAYVDYEKEITGNKIIAILANTEDDRLKVWWGSDVKIDESHQLSNQYSIKSFEEYAELYTGTKNNREQVIKNTYQLNETLHKHGISEGIRSQFVGTCLLALKQDIKFENLTTKQILAGIEEVITNLLGNDINKITKLAILKSKVLDAQHVRSLKSSDLQEILREIKNNILPHINEKSTAGQDLLNLFFTTFNKYVGKADKNQAFTPDHIVHFMCKVVGVNRNSRVLDPCVGSGAFLVRAMTEAMDDCANELERKNVKKNQIYGIEVEETAFGLATTNMLIHGDGNSNIFQGSCFALKDQIEDANINIVLMNPPYNAQRRYCDPDYVKNWTTSTVEDPSQGFHFVHYIASIVKTGKLAVLLPMQCAIGSSKEIQSFKEKMLVEHTLDAVFSLPSDVFHPGANASACCMVFNLGNRHQNSGQDTFFGYFKDDGFVKKKNLGRVEKTKNNSMEGVWADIESEWLSLYRHRKTKTGVSITKKVKATDEWLAEVHMDTDYRLLNDNYWIDILRKHVAYQLLKGDVSSATNSKTEETIVNLHDTTWSEFKADEIFTVKSGVEASKLTVTDECGDDGIQYLRPSKSYSIANGFVSADGVDVETVFEDCLIMGNTGAGSHTWTYYIPRKFIPNNNLSVLITKHTTNKYHKIFLMPIIEHNRFRYDYGRVPSQKRFLNSTIQLPSKTSILENNGEEITKISPDWDFMESYIKSLPYSSSL